VKSSYQKHLDLLEAIALRGQVSSYELSKILHISVSHAQWWLKNYPAIREVRRERVRRQRVFYGLTMIGFLMALKRPKVKRNFRTVFTRFLETASDEGTDPKLKENLLEALESEEVSERYKEFYLAVSEALDDLMNIYDFEDDTIVNLATYLANLKDPEKMGAIYRALYPKVLLIQRIVDAYRQYASNLDRMMTGDLP
jgi:hypothetical protein